MTTVPCPFGCFFQICSAWRAQTQATGEQAFECIKANVNGAMDLIDAGINQGVKRVVALSTGKASNKRLRRILWQGTITAMKYKPIIKAPNEIKAGGRQRENGSHRPLHEQADSHHLGRTNLSGALRPNGGNRGKRRFRMPSYCSCLTTEAIMDDPASASSLEVKQCLQK